MSAPSVGYCTPHDAVLASWRLRVDLPRRYHGLRWYDESPADVCFFYKHHKGDVEKAKSLSKQGRSVVFDITNDWFDSDLGKHYRGMAEVADVLTCSSKLLIGRIRTHTGKDAVFIPDPNEQPRHEPHTNGRRVCWFGHAVNLESLRNAIKVLPEIEVEIVSNVQHPRITEWTPDSQAEALAKADIVLITGSRTASVNRMLTAVMAGCYVVAQDIPSYAEFGDLMWVNNNLKTGIEWAFDHPDECRERVAAAQRLVQERYSPETIGGQWREVFANA